jgi:class 3 adenylate cyclase
VQSARLGLTTDTLVGLTTPASAAAATAIDEERLRSVRWANLIRPIAAALWGILYVIQTARGDEVSGGMLRIQAAYVAFTIALYFAARRWPRILRLSWTFGFLLDLPFIVFTMGVLLHLCSSREQEVAVVTGGNGLLLIIVGAHQMLLRGWAIFGAAAMAALLSGLALFHHDVPFLPYFLLSIVLIGVITAAAAARTRALVAKAVEEQSRRDRLGRYFSPEVAQRIAAAGIDRAGEERDVTVLICDLRDYTAMSETLDGATLVATLDEFYATLVDAVYKNGGTLDKFTGDGMLAYFGAPLAQDDHAARAVRCALDMVDALAALNQRRSRRAALRMGVGLHTGRVYVGDMGPPQRREYTVIGAAVNLAARIEALTKTHGVEVLASEATQKAAGDICAWTAAAPVSVKGVREPVPTFLPARR